MTTSILSKVLKEAWPKIGQNFRFSAKFFWLRIGWNENFIMQLTYSNKNLFYNFFSFVIEKFVFPVKMLWEKEVLWIYSFSFGYVWKIFILPFLNTLGYTLFKKYNVLTRHFRLELLPFRRGVTVYRSQTKAPLFKTLPDFNNRLNLIESKSSRIAENGFGYLSLCSLIV